MRPVWRDHWENRHSLANEHIAGWLQSACVGLRYPRILDVGCGDSFLARSLPGAWVEGITVNQVELERAQSEGFPCRWVDKYTEAFAGLAGNYDFIVDVTPFGFAEDMAEIRQYLSRSHSLLKLMGSFISEWGGVQWRWTVLPELYEGQGKVVDPLRAIEFFAPEFEIKREGVELDILVGRKR